MLIWSRERFFGDRAQVVAIEQDAPARRIVKARDEREQRAFARAGAADEGDGLARRDAQVDPVEDRAARGVATKATFSKTIAAPRR